MKKILVLASTFPRWAGDTSPPFVFNLSDRLSKRFEVTVLTPHCPGSKDIEIMNGMKVHRFHYFVERYEKLAGTGGILPALKKNKWLYLLTPFFFLFEILATIALTKKIKPEIVHAHWIIPQGIAAYINFLVNRTPYIITSHGSDLHSLGLKWVKRIILNKAKKITVVSNYLKEEIKKIDPKLLSKTEVIPMGVDTKQFNPSRYDQKIKSQHNIKGKFLLFVGRLAPEKGIDLLINAMPAVINKYPKTKLLIIGGGLLEQTLKDSVNAYKIHNNVIFLGPVDHNKLPSYFATADVFVSPSLREGLPTTYLEAMASGLFLLVGDIPISREIITDKEVGEVVKHDSHLIATKIIKQLSRKTKPKVSESIADYDQQAIANRFIRLINDEI